MSVLQLGLPLQLTFQTGKSSNQVLCMGQSYGEILEKPWQTFAKIIQTILQEEQLVKTGLAILQIQV